MDMLSAFYRGLDKLKNDLYNDAIIDFCDVIMADLGNSDAYYMRGFCYFKKGDALTAYKDFMKAQSIDSTKSCYLSMAAICKNKLDELSEAIDLITKAIELEPKKSSYWCLRGIFHHKEGDYNTAISDFMKSCKLDPNNISSREWLGIQFYAKGFIHEAYDNWIVASKLGSECAPNYLDKYFNNPETEYIEFADEDEYVDYDELHEEMELYSQYNSTSTADDDITINFRYSTILNKYNINGLYHMTHVENLHGILINGLLSHNQAHQNDKLVDISDREVNERREKNDPIYNISLHEYVPLYFNPKNPMLFRRRSIQDKVVIIEIYPSVLFLRQSLFTDGNAASANTTFYSSIDDLDKINWKILSHEYWNDYEDGKRIKCAEVLVKRIIAPRFIRCIHFNKDIIRGEVKTTVDKFRLISMKQSPAFYFNK